jgi:hypothetical protein
MSALPVGISFPVCLYASTILKDGMGICRVAAYLNNVVEQTPRKSCLKWEVQAALLTPGVGIKFEILNMSKRKRKLTPAEKLEKKRGREQYMTVFINAKQKRVKRPTTIDGMEVDEFIRRNADPIWLHQNEIW